MAETGTLLDGARPERAARTGRASRALGLVGDIGGTNARFALTQPGDDGPRIVEHQSFRCRDFTDMADVMCAYLEGVGLMNAPPPSVIAVAGPVTHGAISLTNLGWSFSEPGLRQAGLGSVRLINDYEALAAGAPHYRPADLRHAGGPLTGPAGQTIAVVGAGTGFGVACLVTQDGREVAVATEGGHVSFAPVDPLEVDILARLTARFGRVSVERILSGPGLAMLHEALCEIHGEPVTHRDPAAITAAALAGDVVSARTVEQFCAILGSVAGDMALALGARGGVYIGSGIAPAMGDLVLTSRFRRRFEAKGRFEAYMHAIPTWIITHPHAALISAARLLAAAAER